MPELLLHNRLVNTVFDLLGKKENDITFSIGWALARCDEFSNSLLRVVFKSSAIGEVKEVLLQAAREGVVKSSEHGGFTDIELLATSAHVIVEAKRGWNLPTENQLTKYIPRFQNTLRNNALVVIAECTPDYASRRLPRRIGEIPVVYLSWRRIWQLAGSCHANANPAGRRVLNDVCNYLEGLMTMQDTESNLVFVVALSADKPTWSNCTWQEVVAEHDRYFCPFAVGGWPKQPPNYIAFRYQGRLQSIRHIESYVITETGAEIAAEVSAINPNRWDRQNKSGKLPHFVFRLGPTIHPPKTVKTGRIFRNGRVWAALDLLLTCDSISDARDQTKARRLQAGQ